MSNRGIVRIWAAAGAALLATCAPAIRSQRDEAIPIPQGATWAWAAPDPAGPADTSGRAAARRDAHGARPRPARDPSGMSAIPRQRFHRALEAALEAKGFHKVDEASDADFLLTLALEPPDRPSPGRGTTAVTVGWYGGRGPWGRFHPWGGFGPWGGWAWQPWGFSWYGVPYWDLAATYPIGPHGPREMMVVALLRVRSTGDVAWLAQYRADAYDLAFLTQRRAQEVAEKLVASLR